MLKNMKELNFKTGDRYLYCNTAYMLLADIVSKASGQPFESWMQANIFRPLGMENTYIMDEQGELFPNCADSYSFSSNGGFIKIFDNSTIQGAGGIYPTIPDLAKWVDNYCEPRTGTLATVEQMLQLSTLNNGDHTPVQF